MINTEVIKMRNVINVRLLHGYHGIGIVTAPPRQTDDTYRHGDYHDYYIGSFFSVLLFKYLYARMWTCSDT